MKKITFFIMLISSVAFGQQGGLYSYQFLDLDFNARAMALGGDFIGVKDGDIDLAVANPSVISDDMHNHLSLNHFFYPSGINYGQFAYGRTFEKVGTFVGHLRYVAYGSFDRMDELGINQGTFTAGDYALGVGYGRDLNKYFSIGANMNFIFSHMETYTSFGMAADISSTFYHPEANLTVSLVAKNVGYQFKGYTTKNHEPLPIQVLAGVSYKFHHAPFRLSLVGTDLTNWDLTYNDPTLQPTIDQLTGDTIPVPKASFAQKVAYHTNFGLEIVPKSERFYFRLGFNFGRRNGLGVENRRGIGGFSTGFGIRLKKFAFNYGLSFYSVAGVSNSFGITTNINEWKKSKKKVQSTDN
ncbi:type IX secretion system protein PorQ [Paracrocinitomix mangrovi]|uniref:type IX secretion system protein PorQ n=1 Tax=Paracrocinitomix mangrovi TaxID=2862509 RepID=UPI001C8D79DC|nr:type IX secretion system protein PorQ [Paracrocinitomix mangrovi]UKN01384.1 type IX secretion system protein PorQ [Paracrocinitomix mangrovi]